MAKQRPEEVEQELLEAISNFERDPLGFVLFAFPWGEGELEKFEGPDQWQVDVLNDLGKGLITIDHAIRIAVASGHGIGKSALVSWIILWAMSTLEDTKGVVTANTENQLKTKTWAELAKWHRLLINTHWFKYEATAIFSVDPKHEKTWRIDMVPWSETRTESFAGLHNKGKRILVVFDEASAIPDVIWEVAEGALTDEETQIIQCAFGNPTRSRGRFKECFGRFKQRWITRQIDSRTARMTNKQQIAEWIDDYGIDSDFIKVRVLGQFPSADVNALFTADSLEQARARRMTERDIAGFANIFGVDVARQGMDDSVIARRQGRQLFPLVAMHVPDATLVAGRVANATDATSGADAVFIDATGGYGTGVVDSYRQMGRTCNEVYFSGKALDARYFNKRSEMAFLAKLWIEGGGAIPDDALLIEELGAISYTFSNDKLRICEKDDIKDEIGRSPDRADAFMLTFAFPVVPRGYQHRPALINHQHRESASRDYDPLERA